MTYNISMLYSEKRIYVVKQFLLIIAIVLFSFGIWRIYTHNNIVQALIELFMTAVIISVSILIHYRPATYNMVTIFGLLMNLGFILFTMKNLPHAASSLLWMETFVLLAFLLRSRSEGWFWTALAIGTTLILNYYFLPNKGSGDNYNYVIIHLS